MEKVMIEAMKNPAAGAMLLVYVAIFLTFVVAALFLITRILFQGIKLKKAGPVEFETGVCPDEIYKSVRASAWIVSRVEAGKRGIVIAQKDAIQEHRHLFLLAADQAGMDPIFSRLFLFEFEEILSLTAENNHVLDCVKIEDDYIDKSYLDRKMLPIEARFRSLTAISPCKVNWEDLEQEIKKIVEVILFRFAEIAIDRRSEIANDVETIKNNLGVSEAVAKFIDTILEDLQAYDSTC